LPPLAGSQLMHKKQSQQKEKKRKEKPFSSDHEPFLPS
jgi:hypothetical protein